MRTCRRHSAINAWWNQTKISMLVHCFLTLPITFLPLAAPCCSSKVIRNLSIVRCGGCHGLTPLSAKFCLRSNFCRHFGSTNAVALNESDIQSHPLAAGCECLTVGNCRTKLDQGPTSHRSIVCAPYSNDLQTGLLIERFFTGVNFAGGSKCRQRRPVPVVLLA